MHAASEALGSHGNRKKSGQELLLGLFLLIPTALGAFLLSKPLVEAHAGDEARPNIISQQLMQGAFKPEGKPLRALPARFKTIGVVDEQYTVGEDPSTGEVLINDSLGSIGTNNTSIEGDRALLAREMAELDAYAEKNRANMPPDGYFWLKKVASTGIKLAFGTPGLPPASQPPIKQELLADFHHISANPTESILRTDKYLELEGAFEKPEAIYQNPDTTQSNFLKIDSVSPVITTWEPSMGDFPNLLATMTLSPSLSQLSLASGSFNYTSTYSTSMTLSGGTYTSGSATTSPSLTSSTSGTDTNTSGSTAGATDASTTTTSPDSLTMQDYYDSTLGTNSYNKLSPSTETITDTSQVTISPITMTDWIKK